MNRIVQQTEISRALDHSVQGSLVHASMHPKGSLSSSSQRDREEAMAFSMVQASQASASVSAIVIENCTFENGGQELSAEAQLPTLVAKYQPNVPIFLAVPTYKAGRLLQVYRGMKPVLSLSPANGFLEQLKTLNVLAKDSAVVHAVFDAKTKSSSFRIVTV